MFSISNILVATKLKKVMSKAGIEVVHFIPGRIRLKSPFWKQPSQDFIQLIDSLGKETDIKSISLTKETGSLVIEFELAVLEKPELFLDWVNQFEKINMQCQR